MEGISQLTDKVVEGTNIALVQLFDHVIARLSDANSKVNIHAFTCLNRMLPYLPISANIPAQSNPDTTITRLLMAVCNAMISTNPQVKQAACTCFDICLISIDCALLTPCLPAVLNGKSRSVILERLSQNTGALKRMYEAKPPIFIKHVVSIPMRVIKSNTQSTPQLRQVIVALVKSLYSITGDELWKGIATEDQRKIKEMLVYIL
jgi:hypothetical protein